MQWMPLKSWKRLLQLASIKANWAIWKCAWQWIKRKARWLFPIMELVWLPTKLKSISTRLLSVVLRSFWKNTKTMPRLLLVISDLDSTRRLWFPKKWKSSRNHTKKVLQLNTGRARVILNTRSKTRLKPTVEQISCFTSTTITKTSWKNLKFRNCWQNTANSFQLKLLLARKKNGKMAKTWKLTRITSSITLIRHGHANLPIWQTKITTNSTTNWIQWPKIHCFIFTWTWIIRSIWQEFSISRKSRITSTCNATKFSCIAIRCMLQTM